MWPPGAERGQSSDVESHKVTKVRHMTPQRIRLVALAAVLAITSVPPTAIAAQAGEKQVHRQLSGHYFLPNHRGKDPFVNTYVRSSTSLGIANDLSVPFFDLQGNETTTLEGDLFIIRLEFEYQQAVAEWLAFRALIGGSARIGTDEQVLLATGISAIQSLALGGSARIYESDRFYLSGTVDFVGSTLIFVDPLAFVQDVIDEGELNPGAADNLAGDETNLRSSVGLRAAYSPAPWLGFTGVGETGIGSPFEEEDKTEVLGSLTLGASVDFRELSSVPMGLLMEFQTESFSPTGEDLARAVRTWSFGLHYTGARDFSLALTPRFINIPLKTNDVTIDGFILDISIRYFF